MSILIRFLGRHQNTYLVQYVLHTPPAKILSIIYIWYIQQAPIQLCLKSSCTLKVSPFGKDLSEGPTKRTIALLPPLKHTHTHTHNRSNFRHAVPQFWVQYSEKARRMAQNKQKIYHFEKYSPPPPQNKKQQQKKQKHCTRVLLNLRGDKNAIELHSQLPCTLKVPIFGEQPEGRSASASYAAVRLNGFPMLKFTRRTCVP